MHATAGGRRQLTFAAAAVLLAAADTYVVVVALPAIMAGVGVGIGELQRATPVVSGYLLGYTAVLPLLGRLSDRVGRRPVLLGCLSAFAMGSVVTATARSLSLLVAGRALQGRGGGGLVPVTLALVAAEWPADRRGLPLGVVGGVQELGSVLGPLYGAAVVAVAGWRWIFWLNVPLASIIAVGLALTRSDGGRSAPGARRRPLVAAPVAVLGLAAVGLALAAPPALAGGVVAGTLWVPLVGQGAWAVFASPLALAGFTLLLAAAATWALGAPGPHPAAPLRRLVASLAGIDLPGAALLAGALACVVVAFSTTDPATEVVSSKAPELAVVAAVCVGGLLWRQRSAATPLLDRSAMAARPVWGALAVNLATGAALMAALVDVPLFARATVDVTSQVRAAVVLVRLLAAVPVGAIVGGWALRRLSSEGPIAAAGLALSSVAFVSMTGWGASALAPAAGASTWELAACGLGFGLAIAPLNAAVLRAVPASQHGLATSLLVVARTVGMLVGISALTAVGLHRFYRASTRVPSPFVVCPSHPAACPAVEAAQQAALLAELHTVFAGAGLAAAAAAALSLLLLRR